MQELHEFTMSGLTIDFLKIELEKILKHAELNEQQHIELVNMLEALDAPDGFNVRFEFTYNSVNTQSFKLKKTCNAAPELYEVFNQEDEQVAVLRLRWGHFTAMVPDDGGTVVYKANPIGISSFVDEERQEYLDKALAAVERDLRVTNRI